MRVGWLIGVRKSSITQWLNLLLYLEGKGLEVTSMVVKCMADALSKQRYVGLACGTWEQEFFNHFVINQSIMTS